jgi:hypothetical protein
VDYPNGVTAVKFTPANLTYTKYEWFFGEGATAVTTSASPSTTHVYPYLGKFNVILEATNNQGCTCRGSETVAWTGLEDISGSGIISIYPNPNQGVFTINNNLSAAKPMTVEVFNILGSKIYSETTTASELKVDLGSVAKGVYVVKVMTEGNKYTAKVNVN